jgi:membrane protein implicated in regulation of membrane protease activity
VEIFYDGVTAFVVWGAFVGGLLGLALQYRWRAILIMAVAALAVPVWFMMLEFDLWLLAGGALGLVLGLPVMLLERRRERRESQSLRERAGS